MNLTKKAFALFLLASLSAGQAQAGATDSIGSNITQMCNNKVTKLIENGSLIPVLFGAAMTLICGLTTYKCYKVNVADLSTRIITIPCIPFFGFETMAFCAATITAIYNA